ncbi:MAG: molecular chaperone DnaK [Anaerotignum sp.]|nr:molecular chaperone DnaK [Anaerotignum sp.]MBP3307544.1 molecular chaperone DnaK [Anaerotignum sp.]
MAKTIGIDLGTTNSCVSVIEGGRPVIIPNDKGERTTPSIVAFTKDGARIVGEAAQRQAVVNSQRTISSVKRSMGTNWNINIDGKKYTAPEISAMILRKLRQDAENYLGESITDAVITVPAYFNDAQRQATKDAGRIAGLNVKRIINEPTSAALAYGLDHGEPQKIMVFDLGGGTFDVSIIEIGDGVIEVLATNGDNHLGGDDFDERITNYLCDFIRVNHGVDVSKDLSAMQRIREASEQAKKELSSSETANINLPYLIQGKEDMIHFETVLTREKFNELTSDLVERTATPVMTAMNDAGLAPSELQKVLLVGGSTRMPSVQEKVFALTGIAPSKDINPDECVAQGAAIQADTLSGSGTGLLLLDVIPLSLSIETAGGVATKVIERNTTLPVRYSQVFTTASAFQRSVRIHVVQGERPMAKDNKTIGKFNMKGIKKPAKGIPQIEVTFDVDTNGILKISAKDLTTGKEQSITITDTDKMSDEEIDAAIKNAEQYSAHDRMRQEAMELPTLGAIAANDAEASMKKVEDQLTKEEIQLIKRYVLELRVLVKQAKPEKMNAEEVEIFREHIDRVVNSSANARKLAKEAETKTAEE